MRPEDRQCTALRAGGGRCSNRAQSGQEYCWSHSPQTAQQRTEYARAGGKARSRRTPDELEKLKREIKAVTLGVLNGKVDRSSGAIVLQGFNVLLRAVEMERKLDRQQELEAQVEELRTRMQEIRRKRQWAG